MHHKHNVMFMLVTILVESSIESEIKAKNYFFRVGMLNSTGGY